MRNSIIIALLSILAATVAKAANEDPKVSVAKLKSLCEKMGKPTISGKFKAGDYEVPDLMCGKTSIRSNDHELVANVTRDLGGICTLFVRTVDDKNFIRLSTTVLHAKTKKRCINTALINPGPVYDRIIKGLDYEGDASICDNDYKTYYEPIKDGDKVIGIYLCGYLKNAAGKK
mgnify:CR=1 FL=1